MQHWDHQNQRTLTHLVKQFETRSKLVEFSGFFYPTKGKSGLSTGKFERCLDLEDTVKSGLMSDKLFEKIMKRYQEYDPRLMDLSFPSHYASRFVELSGPLADNFNIFLFFPNALGLVSDNLDDYFGIEFIDIWSSVFTEIVFPCAERVFDDESLQYITQALGRLDQTVYTASIFHEIGHRVGPWRVSPCQDERLHIQSFHLDLLGELSTDSLMVSMCEELSDLSLFIFLQRIFWFGRFGYEDNQVSGSLNTDNDCWNGAYLWNQYLSDGVLVPHGERWKVNFTKLTSTFRSVVRDIDNLANRLIEEDDQDIHITAWMRDRVDYNIEHGFVYPKSMKEVFDRVSELPHVPTAKVFPNKIARDLEMSQAQSIA